MEVPENKRRLSIVKGVVRARRNAGLNSTFRIRRLVGGVGNGVTSSLCNYFNVSAQWCSLVVMFLVLS
ncbi:unnamed protein product [Arabidopsis arenosa]|uniref:Uncharacterized protein n=1 Tax=Arabidopsis arenosa TaxID=38785 RepID=A0A8S2A4Z6_ARAAE|nr:unnamed protein product [Arabidopsis arenosa]